MQVQKALKLVQHVQQEHTPVQQEQLPVHHVPQEHISQKQGQQAA